jgi:hypothetical protein
VIRIVRVADERRVSKAWRSGFFWGLLFSAAVLEVVAIILVSSTLVMK